MRDDAARALRVDDEPPRDSAELHQVATVLDSDGASRRFGRPSPEATMALRHFERLVDGSAADEMERSDSQRLTREPGADADHAPRRTRRDTAQSRPARRRSGPAAPAASGELDFDAIAAALTVADAEPVREPEPARDAESTAPMRPPLNAPGRSYGSRPRRTVQITGQAQAPRRRPEPITAAFTARPDRIALWAFMLAMFLVVMAIATAHP
jgi:hypothetical protein